MDRDMAVSLVKKLTSYTKYYGVVNIVGASQGVTRFARSEISQNVNQYDISISLTLHDGSKEATCTTNVLDNEGLKKLAEDTENLLAAAPHSSFSMVPWQRPSMRTAENDDDLAVLYNARGRVEAIKEGVSMLNDNYSAAGALTLERKIAAYGNSESQDDEILFSSLDNVQFNTVVSCDAAGRSGDAGRSDAAGRSGTAGKPSTSGTSGADGSGECISHKFGGLNIMEQFSKAKRRADLGTNPITIDGGKYTVILTPQAMGDLVFYITWSLNAKRVAEGLSFCNGNLPKAPAFAENISIYDDVNDPRVFPLYFDYEGHKRRSLPLIEKGNVKNLLFDNKTSQLMGARQTGHAVSNKGIGGFSLHTVMLGGDSTIDDMIKNTERGLFVSELHYTNFVNPRALQVTGLTRNGTFLIENGKITLAVNTMRFTQNLLEAFNNISALSKELTIINGGGWAHVMPAAKIEGMTFND